MTLSSQPSCLDLSEFAGHVCASLAAFLYGFSGRAEVERPRLQALHHHGLRPHCAAIGEMSARQDHAIGSDDDVIAREDRQSSRLSVTLWNDRACEPTPRIIVGRCVDADTLRRTGMMAELNVRRDGKMRLPTDMVSTRKRQLASGGEDAGKRIYPHVIAKPDVRKSDDDAVLSDLHVLANMGEPHPAQFLGVVEPHIEGILHPENLRPALSPCKRKTT